MYHRQNIGTYVVIILISLILNLYLFFILFKYFNGMEYAIDSYSKLFYINTLKKKTDDRP